MTAVRAANRRQEELRLISARLSKHNLLWFAPGLNFSNPLSTPYIRLTAACQHATHNAVVIRFLPNLNLPLLLDIEAH